MSTSNKIEAFPHRIGPYNPPYVASPSAMKKWLDAHLPTARKFVIDGVVTFVCREGSKLTLFVHAAEELLYVMELFKLGVKLSAELPPELRRRANYQGSVWRSKHLQSLHDSFASAVFDKLLLSGTRNVVSDSQQSADGEAFWYRRCLFALRNGLHVYGLDCELKSGTLVIEKATLLKDLSLFDTFYSEGEDYSGYYKRLAIVKKS